jgi:hypothetical protein
MDESRIASRIALEHIFIMTMTSKHYKYCSNDLSNIIIKLIIEYLSNFDKNAKEVNIDLATILHRLGVDKDRPDAEDVTDILIALMEYIQNRWNNIVISYDKTNLSTIRISC